MKDRYIAMVQLGLWTIIWPTAFNVLGTPGQSSTVLMTAVGILVAVPYIFTIWRGR